MTDNLTVALAAVQADLPTVGKDQKATVKSDKGSYTYKYADLAAVSAAILPLLSKNGLAWTTLPTFDEQGRFVLRYELRHVSGESLVGSYPLPTSGRPQEMGSAITYARRYALCAATGVAPEDDDDNASTAERAAVDRENKAQAEYQLKNDIWAVAKERGWIKEDGSYEELSADFTTWNEGGDIEGAPEPVLRLYLAHLKPKQRMQRKPAGGGQ